MREAGTVKLADGLLQLGRCSVLAWASLATGNIDIYVCNVTMIS